mmetsp:Transcript_4062/g.9842  ORF Transcript_4062/g.9842 Transcript_4062/m.9842 type:complete len:243 (-) Transcript_4062:44-772(-)
MSASMALQAGQCAHKAAWASKPTCRRQSQIQRQCRTVVAAAEAEAAPATGAGGGERAALPKEYTYHTPGSVQETDDKVVFGHQMPAEASKWANCSVSHVGDGSSAPVRVGVVIGEFHNTLMDRMLEDVRLAALSLGATVDEVVWVPGTYDAPLVVERMLENEALDAVVVVGYIEKGSTLHGQEMGATCSLIFKQLELAHNKPVGMGIIGPGATAEQAESRVAYAGNAMRAAVRMARYMAKTA